MTSPFQLAAGRRQQAPVQPTVVLPRVRRRTLGAPGSTAERLNARRVAMQPEPERRSFLGQIGDAFTGIFPGAAHLARSAAVTAAAPVRAAIDYQQGEIGLGDAVMAGTMTAPILGFLGNDRAEQVAERYNPFGDEFGDSMQGTLGRVRHPSRYVDAWNEGRIVGTVLEDAGNVAIIGGVGARAAGGASRVAAGAGAPRLAAGLERAGAISERIARPLDRIADAPTSVLRGGVNRVRGGIVRGFEDARAGRFGVKGQERAVALARRLPASLTSETGAMLQPAARQAERQARRAQTKVERRLYQGATQNGLSLAEQGVATAVRTGLADQVRNLVRQGADPEVARRMTTLRDIPEQTLTPEVSDLAIRYLDGTLPDEQMARITAYMNVVDETIGQQTERALAGAGRPGGPMDPRYPGDDVLLDEVDRALRAGGGSGLDENGNLIDPADDAMLQEILDSPEVYPAKWRPAMRSAGLARRAATEMDAQASAAASMLGAPPTPIRSMMGLDIPLRPADIMDATDATPSYLPGGRSDLADPSSAGIGRVPIREGLPGVLGVRSEQLRATSERQPFSARTIAEKAGNEARTTVMNERLVEMFNDPRIKTVRDMIPASRLEELRDMARREAEAQRGTPEQIAERTAEFFGQNIHDELANEWRHDVLLGDRANPQVGDFKPADKSTFNRITEDSVVLPAGLKDRLIPYMRGKDMGRFFNTLAKLNSKFKGLVLPFSIRWQLGDAVGGAFMAWAGGGIPPTEIFRSMRQLSSLDDAAVRAIFDDLQDSGLNIEEARWMRSENLPTPTTRAGKAWRRAGDVRRASYRLNETINRLNRQSYALAKLQRIMDERGLSFNDSLENQAWQDPEVQRAITDAVEDANKVMGTFDEMTPFERNYVRNVFPFWAWNRHITALAWRTAIDNPSRMMWTLNIGQYGAEQESDNELLPWQRGSIAVGDTLIPTNFINPFNDVGGGSIFTPTGAARALSPGLKLMSAAVGKDANRGFADVTRAYDGRGLDELGRAGGFRPLSPGELSYQAIRMLPQGRAALNALPTGRIGRVGIGPHPRYGSGEFMVDIRGNPIDTESRWQSAFGLVGLQGMGGDAPLLGSLSENEDILAAARRRRREAARRAANTIRFEG